MPWSNHAAFLAGTALALTILGCSPTVRSWPPWPDVPTLNQVDPSVARNELAIVAADIRARGLYLTVQVGDESAFASMLRDDFDGLSVTDRLPIRVQLRHADGDEVATIPATISVHNALPLFVMVSPAPFPRVETKGGSTLVAVARRLRARVSDGQYEVRLIHERGDALGRAEEWFRFTPSDI